MWTEGLYFDPSNNLGQIRVSTNISEYFDLTPIVSGARPDPDMCVLKGDVK